MTDRQQLIEEARREVPADRPCTYIEGLCRRLADALEASERELVDWLTDAASPPKED